MSSTPPRDVAATLRVMDVLKSRPGVRTLSSLVLAGFRMFGVTALWGPEAMVPGAILTVTGMTLLGYLALRHWWIARLELIQGAGRMKAGVFDRPVKVPRGNEYTELAEVLNQVSESVERRLETLEHEREIDRAILSTLDTASITQLVLDYLPGILPCQAASLTALGLQNERDVTTWVAPSAGTDRVMVSSTLTPRDVARALEEPEWFTVPASEPLPRYLEPLRQTGPGTVVACPLHEAGELIGILAVRPSVASPSASALRQLRRHADRTAKALGNSRMMDQVRVLAFYDALTRLPNRVLYRERLGQAIGRARQSGRQVAVCFLDLDHFARINDTLGPARGDDLIREVGRRLSETCRAGGGTSPTPEPSWDEVRGNQVARLGGDEFAILVPDLEDPEHALQLARRVLVAIQEPIRLGSQEVFVTASIGIAVGLEDGADTDTLHKNADVALTAAKKEGRNAIERYSPAMNAETLGRLRLEHELRRAVEQGEFTLWYQPIMDLRARYATGAEALVRWDHPDRGLIPPGEFIQLCEESGIIVPLGEWSLRSVCAQARRWEEEGFTGLQVSVNLSARQLRQRGIVRMVQDILEETGARPGQLTIEMTESLLMEKGGVIERRLRELADLGIRLAIDDFGTGFSSLSYLRNFPVSTLKIDRSFTVDAATDPNAGAITTAIIALAKALDLEVVAEGVETLEQAEFLRRKGCEKAQGYLLGRPAPVQMFTEYLRARQRRQATA